jgi:Winged helix DNA-binding domain
MTRVAAAKVLGLRVHRHRLDRRAPAGSLVDVTRELCGVHAQLAASAELALWARVEGLRRDEVREALEQERTLVKTWAMRGTLHLLAADDLPLYVAVLGPRWDDPGGAWLRGFGVTRKQYAAILEGVPRTLGARPKTREQLADALGELGGAKLREKLLSGWGALLKPSARRGDLCFGPNRGRNVTFVRPDRWLRGFRRLDQVEGLREVVRRFLAAYGPATGDDFTRWLGFRGAEGKRMLRELGDELVEVEVAGQAAWLLADDLARLKGASAPKSVRLLPAFDPYVVGFRPRSLLVDPEHEARIFRPQAWFSPVVLVGGRAVGIWERERRSARVEVHVQPFGRLSAATRRALAAEADRLGEFLDAPAALEVAA